MFCPECRTEYVEGVSVCADCDISLVNDLPPLPRPEYKNYTKLHAPFNAADLAILKSILEGEGIEYYVHNDNFGSLYVGLQIDLFNKQMIMVRSDQYEKARELLSDYMKTTDEGEEKDIKKYSLMDKVRLVFEFLLFGWIMPGRKKVDK